MVSYPSPGGTGIMKCRMAFPHGGRRYRLRRPSFSSPGGRSCRYIDGVMMRGWDLILTGCCWLYEPQFVVSRMSGAVSTRRSTVLVLRLSELSLYVEGFLIRGWDLILDRWRWLHEPQVGILTPWGAVSARVGTVFVHGLLEL